MKYIAVCALLAAFSLAAAPLAAQEIVTAVQYFNLVADRYSQVVDYEAKLAISTGKDLMKGDLSFKSPSFLRVDFTSPPDQVIAFDGQTLSVYIPSYNAILSQSAADKPGAGSVSLATREGLRMLRRNYSVAFETSPVPRPPRRRAGGAGCPPPPGANIGGRGFQDPQALHKPRLQAHTQDRGLDHIGRQAHLRLHEHKDQRGDTRRPLHLRLAGLGQRLQQFPLQYGKLK